MNEIPRIPLIPQPDSDEGRRVLGFKWAEKMVGKRHQIGGAPGFLQEAHIPHCKNCSHPMTFYAQLDSLGDDVVLADCGMIYVFVCMDCFEVIAFTQSS